MYSIQTENSSELTPSTVLYSVLIHTQINFILHKLSENPISLSQRVFRCFVKIGFVHTENLAKLNLSVLQNCFQKDLLTPNTQYPRNRIVGIFKF